MDTPESKTPVIIYAESTPNPATLKFVANKTLLANGATAQYWNKSETKNSPLAAGLFELPFVKAVFISYNYITITKSDNVLWEEITLALREFIKDHLNQGKVVVTELPKTEVHTDSSFKETKTVYTEHAAPQTETEHKIIEVLEQYIRPAVEQDGGLITFKAFNAGVVTVELKGACSGCPSSTMTLKAGIEALLKRMVPEVLEVVAEAA
jgi:NFU1 iron-sulfur cluster scaffold homolog, mitochondrial